VLYDNSVLNGGTAAFISTVHSPPTEFQGYVNAGTAMSSYIVILALLLRLRQACDHPFLALGREAHEAPVEEDTDAIGAANSGTTIVAVPTNSAAAASSSGSGSSASDKITPSYVQQLYARFAAMAGHSSAAVMTPSKAVRSSGINAGASSSSGVSSSSKKRKASGGQQQQQQQQRSMAFVHKVVGELQAKGGLAASVSTVLIAPLCCV
jgi:hypothetical protein